MSRAATDYESYREIMGELLRPITGKGLDVETLKRLHESKLVYLENLRSKSFREINSGINSHFTMGDHALIVDAIRKTRSELRQLLLVAIESNLQKCKAS